MPDRTKVVSAILRISRQIVASDEFARDAATYAEIASDLKDRETASSLRVTVIARKSEIAQMRRLMSRLTRMLANMPI